MKLEITATTIPSPIESKANRGYVIATHVELHYDGRTLCIDNTNADWTLRPLGADHDDSDVWGTWEATFYKDNKEVLGIGLGVDKLPFNLDLSGPLYAVNVYSVEGLSEPTAAKMLISHVFDQLLRSPLIGPNVVIDQYLDLATWLLKTGVLNVIRGELRVTQDYGTYKAERLYKIEDNNFNLKQTLVSAQDGNNRSTKLYTNNDHVRYDLSSGLFKGTQPLSGVVESTNIETVNGAAHLRKSGYSDALIAMYVKESNQRDALNTNQVQQGFSPLSPLTGPAPVPAGLQGGTNPGWSTSIPPMIESGVVKNV